MGTVWQSKRSENRPVLAGTEECSFCGRPASGYWFGVGPVGCCATCAVHVLPALLADSILGEHGDAPRALAQLERALEQAKGVAWRAAALAAQRCREAANDHAACGPSCPVRAGRRLSNGSN